MQAITNYVFSTYIIQLAVSVALLTGSAITPTLGSFIGAKDIKKSRFIVSNVRELITFIAILFGSLVILINRDFIELWMGHKFYVGRYSNILIVFSMVFLILTRFEGQVEDLSLKIKNKVIAGFILSIFSILLGIIGFYLFQNRVEGLFLGILIGRVALYFVFTNIVNKMIGITSNNIKFIYLLICLGILFGIENFLPVTTTWVAFISKLIIVFFMLVVLYFLIVFSKFNRRRILNVFINLDLKNLNSTLKK